MQLTGDINTLTEVVVDERYKDLLPGTVQADSASVIRLIHRSPNRLEYEADIQSEQVAVFSEIFYDKGWHAYINNEEVPYFRANYLLRAMTLKPGKYTVEFRFAPSSYHTGNTIALIASVILFLLIAGYIVIRYTRLKKKTA